MAPKDDEDDIENHEKAIIIQCFIRCTMSRIRVKKKARITWKRIFDPSFDVYFWYNSINGSSQWDVPKYMELFNDRDLKSSIEIQKIVCLLFNFHLTINNYLASTQIVGLSKHLCLENALQGMKWKYKEIIKEI